MLFLQQVIIIFCITKNVHEGNELVVVYRIIPSARKITIHFENNLTLSRNEPVPSLLNIPFCSIFGNNMREAFALLLVIEQRQF